MSNSRIELAEIRIEEISKIYDLSKFDCEDKDLNEFLKQDSFEYKKQLIAKTFIAIYKEQVIAFFSMMNDSIKLKLKETEETKKLRRLHEYPAIKIGRLGVDKKYKRKGVGKIIIKFAIGLTRRINEISACRFVTVDSYPNAVSFYEKISFIKNLMYEKKREFVSMRLDIIDLI